MIGQVESYLPYLLPPLLGAFIGYVTNYIAIRMLFRPLRAWRVLGLRVPMTPGIIPAKRHELAARMGEMVGSHLLTAGDVGLPWKKTAFAGKSRGRSPKNSAVFLIAISAPWNRSFPQISADAFATWPNCCATSWSS